MNDRDVLVNYNNILEELVNIISEMSEVVSDNLFTFEPSEVYEELVASSFTSAKEIKPYTPSMEGAPVHIDTEADTRFKRAISSLDLLFSKARPLSAKLGTFKYSPLDEDRRRGTVGAYARSEIRVFKTNVRYWNDCYERTYNLIVEYQNLPEAERNNGTIAEEMITKYITSCNEVAGPINEVIKDHNIAFKGWPQYQIDDVKVSNNE